MSEQDEKVKIIYAKCPHCTLEVPLIDGAFADLTVEGNFIYLKCMYCGEKSKLCKVDKHV